MGLVVSTRLLTGGTKLVIRTFTTASEGFQIVNTASAPLFEIDGSNGKAVFNQGTGFGIGTSSPQWTFQVATTSANPTFRSQLTLTDMNGATNAKHWNIRSIGGNFQIGTSTDAFATSTYLTIANGGRVGIGTVSPEKNLHVALHWLWRRS